MAVGHMRGREANPFRGKPFIAALPLCRPWDLYPKLRANSYGASGVKVLGINSLSCPGTIALQSV